MQFSSGATSCSILTFSGRRKQIYIGRSSSPIDLFTEAPVRGLNQSGKRLIQVCPRTETFIPLKPVNLWNFDAPDNTRLKSKSDRRLHALPQLESLSSLFNEPMVKASTEFSSFFKAGNLSKTHGVLVVNDVYHHFQRTPSLEMMIFLHSIYLFNHLISDKGIEVVKKTGFSDLTVCTLALLSATFVLL